MPDTPVRTAGPSFPTETSYTVIRAAIRWAESTGLKVLATADPGVHCTSTALGTWEADPHFTGVSPLGSAILYRQAMGKLPIVASIDVAEWMAVGETRRWSDGFHAGVAGLSAPKSWANHAASHQLMRGYMQGREIFNAATLVTCTVHPFTQYPRDGACVLCSDEAPTPYDPNAGRH